MGAGMKDISLRVLVIGSINLDYRWRVAAFPVPGMTTGASFAGTEPGGKGLNQARAARRLGDGVSLAGALGRDAAGEAVVRELDTLGIQPAISFIEGATGQALVVIADSGENYILHDAGANALWPVSAALAALRGHAGPVLVPSEFPSRLLAGILKAATPAQRIYLDGGPSMVTDPALLRQAHVFSPNHSELEQVLGVSVTTLADVRGALLRFRDWGIAKPVLKLGAQGAAICSGADCYLVPAAPVHAVDTTGAGDCFMAALAHAMESGMDDLSAVAWANCSAALSVTRQGVAESFPAKEEVDGLYGAREWPEPLRIVAGDARRL